MFNLNLRYISSQTKERMRSIFHRNQIEVEEEKKGTKRFVLPLEVVIMISSEVFHHLN